MVLPATTLPYQWRVTRYDPSLRDAQGLYPLGDWSCFPDIGRTFGGKELTYERYFAWETVYANTAVSFLADAGLDAVRVVHLDKNRVNDNDTHCKDIILKPSSLGIGMLIPKDHLADVVRLNLREVIWSKLATGIAVGERFFLHFGWDFYMYIGSSSSSSEAIRHAEVNGLFVEPMRSPHLEINE